MNINFIIQSLLILKDDNYNENELRMVYDYVLFLDYEILFMYFMNNTIPGYKNDLCVYIDVVKQLIKKYVKNEEYEKCNKLKIKWLESIKIINDYKTN